jgi:methyl-accepting chemotaxis protein
MSFYAAFSFAFYGPQAAASGCACRLEGESIMKVLNRLKIQSKLALLLALSAISLIAAMGMASSLLYQKMFEERIAKLQTAVDMAIGVAAALDKDVKAGHLTQDQAIAKFRDAVHSMWYDGHKDYLFVFRMDGLSIANAAVPAQEGTFRLDTKDVTGFPIIQTMIDKLRTADDAIVQYHYPKPGQPDSAALPKTSYVKKFSPWNMFIATGVYTDDIDAAFHAVLFKLGLVALAILAVTAAIAWVVSRNIAKPLASLKTKMERLAAGEIGLDISEAGRGDEIGGMGVAVKVFQDNAASLKRLQSEQKDLEAKAAAERKAVMQRMAQEFESAVGAIVGGVSSTAAKLQGSAQTMSSTAEDASRKATAVSAASEQASTNVQTVASAAEELSSSIAEISRQVAESTKIAGQAVTDAERTNTQVQALAEAAQKIGDVVKLINDIAGQTNLLALNATIEAARAGEAGKGFAVVASEVKSLATQTAKATEDISGQIKSIQSATSDSVRAIQGIGQTISQINEIATTIASAVEEQGAATKEIARNVQQASSGTSNVSSNITGVTQAVGKTGAAASEVLGASRELATQSDALRQQVSRFLNEIRAA